MRLVGRQAEEQALAEWLDEAASGSPRVVVCTGEPGIGKTRLAEELTDSARRQSISVAWGFADDTAGTPPYWPWQQVLRALSRDLEIADLASAPTDDAARFRLFEAITGQLREQAADRSVLIVLDDMHWADEASLLLLRHVVRDLRSERLLVLVNSRELSGRPGELLRDVSRAPAARTLPLSGLSASGVREAMREVRKLAPEEAHLRVADAIAEEEAATAREVTGGNPLFLLELARSVGPGRIDPARLPLTPSVREAIAARLAGRSPTCRTLLRAASVMGLYFQPELAGDIAHLAAAEVSAATSEALGASLVEVHDDGFRFAHALIREAILAEVDPRERATLHGAAARALLRHGQASTGSDVFSVAQHLLEAADGDSLEAAEWSERAADVAMRRLAYEDAARWYRTALRAGGGHLTPEVRCRLLLGIGAAANRSGDLSGRLTACVEAAEVARTEGLPEVLGAAALTMEPLGALGFNLTTRRLCEEALAALPEDSVVLRARLRARFAATYVYQPDPTAAGEASAEALAQAEESADPVAIAEAILARLAIAAGPGELDERERLARRLEQISTDTDDPQTSLAAQLAHIDTAFERGNLAEAAARLERAAAAGERLGGPVARFTILHSRAALAQARGRYAEARRTIDEAFAVMAADEVEARFHTRAAVLMMVGRHTGPDDEALKAAGYADAPATARQEPGVIVPISYAVALAGAGQLEAARDVYGSAGPAGGWRVPPHLILLVPAMGIAAAAALGEPDDLERFARDLAAYSEHHVVSGVGAIVYGGPVDLWLGIAAHHLGDLDRAVTLLDSARARCTTNGAAGYEVEAATELAESLQARGGDGDGERASEIVAHASKAARALGMAPFVARLERLAGALGSTLPGGPLTARQVEVAELIAAGLTNRQIADRLTLSERTAENHVQHIMTRLGLTNRSGIAVWVTERKLSSRDE